MVFKGSLKLLLLFISGTGWIHVRGRPELPPATLRPGPGEFFFSCSLSIYFQISNIEDWSNTDVPGLWLYRFPLFRATKALVKSKTLQILFRVGPMDILGNVEGPEKGVRQGRRTLL